MIALAPTTITFKLKDLNGVGIVENAFSSTSVTYEGTESTVRITTGQNYEIRSSNHIYFISLKTSDSELHSFFRRQCRSQGGREVTELER